MFKISGGKRFKQLLKSFLQKEDGPTAVEYAVMLALIIVVCITAVTGLGRSTSETFTHTSLKEALKFEDD